MLSDGTAQLLLKAHFFNYFHGKRIKRNYVPTMTQKGLDSKGSDSYLKYFMKQQNQNQPNNRDDKIHGTCYTMCSLEESNLRIKEKMVHALENCGSEKKLVKSFTRSAADSNLAKPQNLRPYNILHATVTYLLFQVAQRTDASMVVKYDFIDDRLRAVRQDMTIQRLSPQQCAHLLEPMVRFYVYFGYKLHGLPLKDFDPTLHNRNLFECLNWFIKCCDTAADLGLTGQDDPTEFELTELMSDMKINHGENWLAFDPALMEALYILCNLQNDHALLRYIQLPPDLKKDPRVDLAANIAFALGKGNYVAVSNNWIKLCPLGFCAFAPYFPFFQRHTIHVLVEAFNSKRLGMVVENVKKWVGFGSVEEALEACRHYGMPVVDNDTQDSDTLIIFDKTKLKMDVPMHKYNIQRPRENLHLPYVFTYEK